MSLLKPAFLTEPFTIVRGRYHEIDLLFYETYDKKTGTGTLRNLDGLLWVADFRYDLDDENPIFTISDDDSSIVVDNGNVKLILDQTNTGLININSVNKLSFPFVQVYFELKAIDDSTANPMTAAMGILNVYQNGTRSDE